MARHAVRNIDLSVAAPLYLLGIRKSARKRLKWQEELLSWPRLLTQWRWHSVGDYNHGLRKSGRRHPLSKQARCRAPVAWRFLAGIASATEDRWNFGWLDRIIDKLGKQASRSILPATATALAVRAIRRGPFRETSWSQVNAGSRQSWSQTSPVFKCAYHVVNSPTRP